MLWSRRPIPVSVVPLLLSALLAAPAAGTQSAPADSLRPCWENDLQGSATLSLSQFSSWAEGGSDSRTWGLSSAGTFRRYGSATEWTTNLRLEYGEVDSEENGSRKNMDKIFIDTVMRFSTQRLIKPYLAASAKTQFATGYDYDEQPAEAVSGWLDPLVITESGGAGVNVKPWLVQRAGAALKQTVTDRYAAWSDDPDTPGIENVRSEGGVEVVSELDRKVNGTLRLRSRMALFWALDNLEDPDLDWSSDAILQAWGCIGVNYRLQVVYDDDVYRGVQTKQVLGVALNLDLL